MKALALTSPDTFRTLADDGTEEAQIKYKRVCTLIFPDAGHVENKGLF